MLSRWSSGQPSLLVLMAPWPIYNLLRIVN
jgi:hypothetical protein